MSAGDRYLPEPFRDLDISYRQIDHWCRRGWLRPHGQGEGSGNPRWWPPEEIAVARRMVALVEDGYRPAVAATKAREQVSA